MTLNRTSKNNICAAVYAPGQFSWTVHQHKRKVKIPKEFYEIAHTVIVTHPTSGFRAKYFHNKTVKPRWNKRVVTSIGGHKFYE